MYADGFAPRELDLMIVDEHPTLLNVTLFPSKVNPGMGAGGPPSRRPWRPPWLAAPRHRPAAEEEVGGAGERGDHPYTYLPVSDTALQWRDQDSRPSNTTPLSCPRLLLSVALLAWVLTKSWLQGLWWILLVKVLGTSCLTLLKNVSILQNTVHLKV